jgi:hypothetical protein
VRERTLGHRDKSSDTHDQLRIGAKLRIGGVKRCRLRHCLGREEAIEGIAMIMGKRSEVLIRPSRKSAA